MSLTDCISAYNGRLMPVDRCFATTKEICEQKTTKKNAHLFYDYYLNKK